MVEKNVDSSVALSSCQRSAYRSCHTPCFQHASGQATAHVTRPAFQITTNVLRPQLVPERRPWLAQCLPTRPPRGEHGGYAAHPVWQTRREE